MTQGRRPQVSHIALGLFALALFTAPPLTAQKKRADKPSFEGLVEVSEVLLDVLATDTEGEIVLGLGMDDFEVTEDGRPVELTGVSFYTTRYGTDAATETPGEIPWSRYFVLFFHDQRRLGSYGHRLQHQIEDAAHDAQQWVEKEMRPSDWVAVVSHDTHLRLQQDFTQDRDSILFAIGQAALGKKPPESAVPPHRRRLPPRGTPSLARHLPNDERQLRRSTWRIYEAIAELSESMGYIIGRKNLMLFTLGFGRSNRSGMMTWPDPRFYPRMESALNDFNVAVYPIDLTPSGFQTRQRHFLKRLAKDTGGIYFENPKTFLEPLSKIGEDNYGYYLLSFRTEHPAGETGYGRVEVRAADEAVQVRTRRGYRYGL